MNAKSLIPFIAAISFSLSAYGHDCSGGAYGGMDDTGNLCNDVASVADAASDRTAPTAEPATKVATSHVKPGNSSARHTSGTRHASKHTRVAHS